ncbi:unnamed protein product [Moneuplotes crassus]|uniref:Uncharacterized protein n=1 Tax=Euplotes crassus TaxID=5936 RepID=A0AAD2DCL6_EUPCR|nr:unnamed protein product [Moneuplotes crassus]
MGGSFCCARGREIGDLTHTLENYPHKERMALFRKVALFDWNKNLINQSAEHQKDISLCENVMVSLTNDLGFSSPHIAHILICEFIKFLYLNTIMIDIENREGNKANLPKLTINGKDVKVYKGLCAPPYIDQVWVKLYPTQEYFNFCEEILGGYLVRESILDQTVDHFEKYQKTLRYANENMEVIKHYQPLWPKYIEEKHFEEDYNGFVCLTVPELYCTFDMIENEIEQIISKEIEEPKDSHKHQDKKEPEDSKGEPKRHKLHHREEPFSQEDMISRRDFKMVLRKFFKTTLEDHSNIKEQEVSSSLCSMITLQDQSSVRLDDFLENMERKTKDIKVLFTTKLATRFIINNKTAERWIREYFIYLAILAQDPSTQNHAVPSHIISEVWKAHYEFFENYTRVISKLFLGRHIFPDQFCASYISPKDSFEKYESALNKYQELTGCAPEPRIWTPLEDFKNNRCDIIKKIEEEEILGTECYEFKHLHTLFITINIRRLTLAQLVLNYDRIKADQPLEKYRSMKRNCTLRDQVDQHKNERLSSIDAGKRYLWREYYPYCKNVYQSKKIEDTMNSISIKFIKEHETEINQEIKSNIFNKDCLIFISNPLSKTVLSPRGYKADLYQGITNYWKSTVQLDNIDDLCDSFFSKLDFSSREDHLQVIPQEEDDENAKIQERAAYF